MGKGRDRRQHRSGVFALTSGALGIRRGERRVAWLLFAYFFLLACSQYAVKSVRQAAYIDTLGADRLPWVYLLVAVVSLPVLMVYARVVERSRPHRPIIGLCLVQAVVLASFSWILAVGGSWAALVFYVWVTVAFGVAVSQLWSYTHYLLDPRQARRLFAVVAAGGLLGGIPGGMLANLVSRLAGTDASLVAASAVVLAAAGVVLLIERLRPPAAGALLREGRPLRLGEARSGWRTLLGSKLLRLIGVLMALTMIAAQMVDLQFNWVMERVTVGLDQRTAAFGTFFSLMGLLGFLFQIGFTRRIHRVHGVGTGMRVLPLTVAMASAALITTMIVFPTAILAVAWALKLGETGLRHSVDQSTRELLFLPVPQPERGRGKAFIDVFVQRFAKGAAAVLLLPVTFGLLGIGHVGVMTLVVVSLWLWTVNLARREYVQAFRDGLATARADEAVGIDAGDVDTITTLVSFLGSSNPREVVNAIDLLAANGLGRLVLPWLVLHDHAEVRRRVLEVIAEEGREEAMPLVARVAGDGDPVVRGTAVRTMAVLGGAVATRVMRERLGDPDPRVRATAVAFLLGRAGPGDIHRAEVALREMMADGDWRVRKEAAWTLGQSVRERDREALVSLLYDTDRTVVDEAIGAVRRRLESGDSSPMYIPILIALMGDRRHRAEAREAVLGYGVSAIEPLLLFMGSDDERIEVRRAIPKTIALIGGRASVSALVRSIPGANPALRRALIEALAYLRRRDESLRIAPHVVRREVLTEARTYLQDLADVVAVSGEQGIRMVGPRVARDGDPPPGLLVRVLAERIDRSLDTLFWLLELRLSPADARAARRTLLGSQAGIRARALEYLDNSLDRELRRDVFAVIDDEPIADKLRRARQEYGTAAESRTRTIARLAATDPSTQPTGESVVVAALYTMGNEGLVGLRPTVDEVIDRGRSAFVRETAEWVVGRAGKPCRSEEEAMGKTARIEMVFVLQEVDLFSYCTSEQLLRLASIAREVIAPVGEVVYRRRDPADTLYCVTEGRIELVDSDGVRRVAGPRGRFGMVEILSGRLRTTDAEVVEDARLVAIDADDFFDLMANDIEIVKAIFRHLAGSEDASAGTLESFNSLKGSG